MAALSEDGPDVEWGGSMDAANRGGDVVASDIVYNNSFVAFAAAGGIQPVVGDLVFAGLAREKVDNSSGALGDKSVNYLARGVARFRNTSGFSRTDEGQAVYCATDNQADMSTTSTGRTLIGKIIKFHSATDIEVELNAQQA